jgi:hypothetical protein
MLSSMHVKAKTKKFSFKKVKNSKAGIRKSLLESAEAFHLCVVVFVRRIAGTIFVV